MTPAELETYVRRRYNAVGDTFFPQDEIYNFFYDAMQQMVQRTWCIRSIYTTTSVASQRSYDLPDRAVAIRRIEYDGSRILPNDFIDDDSLTGNNADDTSTGDAENYQIWGDTLFLRPIPDSSSKTIKIYTYDEPQDVSSSSTLDVPRRYHHMLADYALYSMFSQDKNAGFADRFLAKWNNNLDLVEKTEAEREIGDAYRVVKHEDQIPVEQGIVFIG